MSRNVLSRVLVCVVPGLIGCGGPQATWVEQANDRAAVSAPVDEEGAGAVVLAEEVPPPRFTLDANDCTRPAALAGGNVHAWLPFDAPQSYALGDFEPSAQRYAELVHQFGVECNPRYAYRPGATFCNIFVWDVTRALGSELPHWITKTAEELPSAPDVTYRTARETYVNRLIDWMIRHEGSAAHHAWTWLGTLRDDEALLPEWDARVDGDVAQELANAGVPVVAIWKNDPDGDGVDDGNGHIAMVVPGTYVAEKGPKVASAGRNNFGVLNAVDVATSFFSLRGNVGASTVAGRPPPLDEVRYYVLTPTYEQWLSGQRVVPAE